MSDREVLAETFQAICRMDAPLNARLMAYLSKLREVAPRVAEAYDRLVARLAAGEIGAGAPAVGDLFPAFVLPASRGGLTSLGELLANGPLVLSFNRGHWCPFCRLELRTLTERAEEFGRYGAQLVSIIPERQFAAQKLVQGSGDGLTVLSDIDNGFALSVGLVMWLGDDLQVLMRERGLHLDVFQGNDGWFVPLPATYVIGRSGEVLARRVDPEFRTRMEMDDIVAALARAQHSGIEGGLKIEAMGREGQP